MIGSLGKVFGKIFGSKSDRDIKELSPIVAEVAAEYSKLSSLSNDDLREKSFGFRRHIQEALSELTAEIDGLKAKAETYGTDNVSELEGLYKEIDQLEKDRLAKLEEVLDSLMPQAFAVVKETARRFTENKELVVTALDFDKNLAAKKDFVRIEGDKAIYKNTWTAAGIEVVWNMVHYDVQLMGGAALHKGKISEMATGEGKTLVSTLPAYLNAIAGFGVHLVTVNDYLARRDCEWNGPLFQFHGLTVDCLDYHQPNSPQRRQAYLADITYGTNNEFGFDYLRDNMAVSKEDIVQRKLHYAMVDEVDSVLIDDARTPLIISGPIPKGDEQEFYQLKPRLEKLVELQKKYLNTCLSDARKNWEQKNEEAASMPLMRAYRGLPKSKPLIKFLGEPGVKQFLLKTENHYLQDNSREMPKVDAELYFVIDEKNNQCELTDKGIEAITSSGEDKNFFIIPDVGAALAEIERSTASEDEKRQQKETVLSEFGIKSDRIHTINQLLKAYTLFEIDVDYIVDEGKVKIVDEQTGRVLDGRRYSDGLHQAIEAKENVKVEDATQTFATITLQNYFRMYHKRAGMTGTAETEAQEFWEIYKMDVVVIPTHKQLIRKDKNDRIYKTRRAKYKAVIDEIEKLIAEGRAVLVGTTSVEISEQLSRMLKMKGIKHNVLNAKQHQREAEIVAQAGQKAMVTIATNMAGRGTDIKLSEEVKIAGGLAIIGTERHESRRVDRQLRGRAGRQGDPGSSQFFVSLEDDLMRLFGSDRMSKVMDRMKIPEDEVIENSIISGQIERSQKKVEQNNFSIRKHLLEYDDVMNNQRTVVYSRRKNALFGDRLAVDIDEMIYGFSEDLIKSNKSGGSYEALEMEMLRLLALQPPFDEKTFNTGNENSLSETMYQFLSKAYHEKATNIGLQAFPVIREVFESRGQNFENILVPFTDGHKALQIVTNLKKAYESHGREVFNSFERMVTLAYIDDAWKEHLRELDDLKQAVRNASYEQKDPLLIYKLESFNLFQQMLTKVNKEVLAMLFKGHIQTDDADKVQEARQNRRLDMSRMHTGRAAEEVPTAINRDELVANAGEEQKVMPVHVGPKVGRNDPCPCGSGKKYKNCHGKE